MADTTYELNGDTKDLVEALNATTAALTKLTKTSDKTDKSVKKTKKTMKGGGEAAKVFAKGVGLAAAAAAAAAIAVLKLTTQVADLRNELSDAATVSGLTVSTLSGLRLAARGSGQEFSTFNEGLKQFPKRMQDVADGTGEGLAAFQQLGVEVRDATGELRSSDDVFKELIENLQDIENPAQRAALFSRALGETLGPGLNLALGGSKLEGYIATVERFGDKTGPEAAAAASEWQEQQALLSITLEKAAGIVADAVLESGLLETVIAGVVTVTPLLTAVIKDATERIIWWRDAIQKAVDLTIFLSPHLVLLAQGFAFVGGAFLSATTSIDKGTAALKEGADAARRLSDEVGDLGESLVELDDQYGESIVTTKESAKVQADYAKRLKESETAQDKAAKSAADHAAALAEMGAIGFDAGLDLVSAEEKVLIARGKQLDQIEELKLKTGDEAHAAVAAAEVKARAERDLAAIKKKANDDALGLSLENIFAEEDAEVEAASQSRILAGGLAQDKQVIDAEALEKKKDFEKAVRDALKETALIAIASAKAVLDNVLSAEVQKLAAIRRRLDEEQAGIEHLDDLYKTLNGIVEDTLDTQVAAAVEGQEAAEEAAEALDALNEELAEKDRERRKAKRAEEQAAADAAQDEELAKSMTAEELAEFQATRQADRDADQETREQVREKKQQRRAEKRLKQTAKQSRRDTRAVNQTIQQEADAAEKNEALLLRDEERAENRAKKLFKLIQKIKRAEATVAAAANAVALTIAFAPAGLLAPVAAGAVAATQLGLQLAVINSTPPPSFHTGSEDISARLRPREAVLTPPAADAVGRDNIRNMNRGGAPGNARQPLQIIFRDRQLDRMMADIASLGGQFSAAVTPSGPFGQVDPFGSRA